MKKIFLSFLLKPTQLYLDYPILGFVIIHLILTFNTESGLLHFLGALPFFVMTSETVSSHPEV